MEQSLHGVKGTGKGERLIAIHGYDWEGGTVLSTLWEVSDGTNTFYKVFDYPPAGRFTEDEHWQHICTCPAPELAQGFWYRITEQTVPMHEITGAVA